MKDLDTIPIEAIKTLPDLNQLKYFCVISKEKSLREGALKLGVSQSSLTRSILALEHDLGVKLLERSRQGIALTPDGHELLLRAEPLLSALTMAQRRAIEFRDSATGQARLAVPATLSSFLLPPLLSLYAADLKKTHISILEGPARQINQWLKAGEVDVGIIVGPSHDRQISAELLYEEELYLMCRTIPAGATKDGITFDKLAQLPLALPLMPLGSRQILESLAEQEGIHLNPVAEVDSPGIQKLLVLHHGLCSVFSRLVCQDELRSGLIHAIPITPAPIRKFYIATREGGQPSPATRLLAHLLRRVGQGLRIS
ncbi:LysR family transcriptional regulator [Bordetella sp. BOR01]|uniref:LysR family transcriptional regulator n=1 Tax=Bordetella sp. BOR01 TaxID=2854779 RepID=UPI001C47DF81|nr:LysR family transcriptional regulator [Bordetella sp. BOR01]MBV7484594.1 LysR family transcriptional regulator [Bordetella sp. BOR01]